MNSRTVLLFASFIALTLLCALLQPSASGQTPPDPVPEHDVTGTVINSVTHQPIAHALVRINGGFATFTDREGRFQFAGVKEPFLTVTAEKPGYFSRQGHRAMYSDPSVIVIQQPLTNTPQPPGPIELIPEAILFGTVTDSSGTPLPGVQLTLYQSLVQNGMKRWQQSAGAATNADGEFRFANLTKGEYRVTTQFHMESFFAEDAREGYLPTRYPEGAGAITLAAGQQKSINLGVRQAKFYPVTGSLSGNRTVLGVNLSVLTSSGEEIQPPRISTPGADTFGILLPDGPYQLRAITYDGSTPLVASTSVSVNRSAVAGVSLNFAALATLPIEVDRESVGADNHHSGSATEVERVSGATDNDQSETAAEKIRPSLYLVSLNPNAPQQYYAQAKDGTPQGPLAFSGVPPGRYLFTGEQVGPWHVTSATCGSTDLAREPLTVAGAAAGCTLHVVFSDASANLAFSATKDGKPVQAFLYLIPVPDLTANVQQLDTSADGTPTTSTLPAGQYDVLAFDKPQDLEYRNPEVMQYYAPYIRSITLAPGQNAALQVEIVPSEN